MKSTSEGDPIYPFVARLEALAPQPKSGPGGAESAGSTAAAEKEGREDRAALAQLKRCAGRPLRECTQALPLFYRLLPENVNQREEETFFEVATLFPFAPRRWDQKANLGRSLRHFRRLPDVNDEGVDRRMTVLLDAGRDELRYWLSQVVRQMAPKEVLIDWRQLLRDLRAWEHPDRYVQRSWARAYYGEHYEKEPPAEESGGQPTPEPAAA